VIVRDGVCWPIDFANATPDMALISLHYYFPWALCALAKWSLYCVVTGRAMRLDTEIARWYAVADDPGRSWEEKLAAYRGLVEDYTRPTASPSSATGTWATPTSAWPSTSLASSSTPTWSPPSGTRSRTTSMSSSWPTTAACCRLGSTTSRPQARHDERT
jgi:hypothetical protein